MSELLDYIQQNKRQIDPLILAGIFHKQMVIIHLKFMPLLLPGLKQPGPRTLRNYSP
jgi:hypothetical protein